MVSDQKAKFETDDLFKKLCQDVDVSSVGSSKPSKAVSSQLM